MGGPQGRLCATAILLLDREREHDTYWKAGLVRMPTSRRGRALPMAS
jgi:hypothetical protein